MHDETRESLDLGGLFLQYRENGDMSAFQALMDALHGPIFNYLLRMTRNRDDAEDALQEVWLKVIRQRDKYDDRGQFTSWIYRIAHNHCLDVFRRRGRFKEEQGSADEDGLDAVDRIASPDRSPREALDEKERMAAIEETVAQLPEAIREVYILRAVHDVPFKEIAEIQDAPLGTVLSRMHQAVNYLKKAIAESPTAMEEMA